MKNPVCGMVGLAPGRLRTLFASYYETGILPSRQSSLGDVGDRSIGKWS